MKKASNNGKDEYQAVRPPLKWAGGKRWLAPTIAEIYQEFRARRMVEPFCGGLAISLSLRPARALINDVNPHLINFYQRLQKGLHVSVPMHNDRDRFLAHREEFNRLITSQRGVKSAKAAQLFYYLNRTGYNGLCRFNRSGKFNVPFGSYKQINYRRDFGEYQDVLANWQFCSGDFAALDMTPQDFIYADPPYDNTFTQYSPKGFDFGEQQRLAQWLSEHKGPVVVSNQATDRMLALYKDKGFTITVLDAPRAISSDGDRSKARELLATRNI